MVFVKNAVAGQVKTRLARHIGANNALKVYQGLLAHTQQVVQQSGVPATVFYNNHIEQQLAWGKAQTALQQGHDLGQRMYNAFAQAFQGGAGQVCIIGSDCPGIAPQHITQAFQALQSHDLVLGPSQDGGYYLLGMRQPHKMLFQNIAWSTPQVRTQTLAAAQQAGLSVLELPVLNDVDTINDLPPNWQQLYL